jgi:hypothetical protein
MISKFDEFFHLNSGGFFVIWTYCATPSLAEAASAASNEKKKKALDSDFLLQQ